MTKLDNATLDAIEAMMPDQYDKNTKRWSGALEWYARKVKEGQIPNPVGRTNLDFDKD